MGSVNRLLRKSPRPDPTSDDHPRILESVHCSINPSVDRSNFNTLSSRNSSEANSAPTTTLSISLRKESPHTVIISEITAKILPQMMIHQIFVNLGFRK